MKKFNFTIEEKKYNSFTLFAIFEAGTLKLFYFLIEIDDSFRIAVIHYLLKQFNLKNDEKLNLCGGELEKVFVFYEELDLFKEANKQALENCLFNLPETEKIQKLLNIILKQKASDSEFETQTVFELFEERTNNLSLVNMSILAAASELVVTVYNQPEAILVKQIKPEVVLEKKIKLEKISYNFLDNKQSVNFYLKNSEIDQEDFKKQMFKISTFQTWVVLDCKEFSILYRELKHPYEKLIIIFTYLYGISPKVLCDYTYEDTMNLLNRETKYFGCFERKFQSKYIDYFREIEMNIPRHFIINKTLGSNNSKELAKITVVHRLQSYFLKLSETNDVFKFSSLSHLKYYSILHFYCEIRNFKICQERYKLSIPMLYKLKDSAFFELNFTL